MIYRELFRWGEERLKQAGITEAKLDARLLLEDICHTDRNALLVHGDQIVDEPKEEQYRTFISQRAAHIPLQHLTGYQDFMGLRFHVNEQVLIPRQDTETLVEEALRHIHDGMQILDLCTGSGCVLLSLLKYSNDCIGVGSDISKEALLVAEKNARDLSIEASFIESNMFEQIKGTFDMIVSNPPYIAKEVIPALMQEVRDHDPMIALDGGEDGLSFYRVIAAKAGLHLIRGGRLFLEIGYDQAEAVSLLLFENQFHDVEICKDLAGNDRVVSGIYGGYK